MAWGASSCRFRVSGCSINCSCFCTLPKGENLMWSELLPGLRISLFATVLLGVVYPLSVTGICQVFFPHQANGSLMTAGGKVIGSHLIGQTFSNPDYFQPRPSPAVSGYAATAISGSNL